MTNIGAATTFSYDADGNRVKRVGPSGTTFYIGYHSELIPGVKWTQYYTFNGQRVVVRDGGAGPVSWLQGDHLGSASMTTDANGTKTSEYRYTPYGSAGVAWGNLPTNRKFTGYAREDALGGIDFAQARFYDSVIGRFLSADSAVPDAGNPQALNRYSYVFNRPTILVDPSGHEPCSVYVGSTCVIRYYDPSGDNEQQTTQLVGNVIQGMVAASGVVFNNTFDAWGVQEMAVLAVGILDLGRKLGSLGRIRQLVGGSANFFRMRGFQPHDERGDPVHAATIGWLLGDPSLADRKAVFFFDVLFGENPNYIRGVAVHELGHIIDYNYQGFKTLSGGVPRTTALEEFIGPYGASSARGGVEYFAEALAQWAYDSPQGNSYRSQFGLPSRSFRGDLRRFLEDELMVHP